MIYGDGFAGAEPGAIGWLIGEENRGLACMFTMMNNARLAVGLQGVAIAERAYQAALAYARDRRQGRSASASSEGMSPIIEHPDIRRTLLTMKAMTAAARAICYATAAFLDRARLSPDEGARHAAAERGALLTPVAKAFSTDIGSEVASFGVQVHGGMGFVEETGAAQHMRDARILAIYEGTNGIQAIDLVTRKLPLSGGATVRAEIAGMRAVAARVMAAGSPGLGATAPRLREAVGLLDAATSDLLKRVRGNDPGAALAVATPYLRLFGLVRGGAALAEMALADGADPGRVALCRFYAENLLTAARGLGEEVAAGGLPDDAPLALAS